jgi:hypothetical protein
VVKNVIGQIRNHQLLHIGLSMNKLLLTELHSFIVSAKAATYVGGGAKIPSCRTASHDLKFTDGNWSYLDSYFGGTDFIGEEVVWHAGNPVWVMNYYGYILKPELITPSQAGEMIKASLSLMYLENCFLGGFQHSEGEFTYFDTSDGEITRFTGREWIQRKNLMVYELVYHGGLVKD